METTADPKGAADVYVPENGPDMRTLDSLGPMLGASRASQATVSSPEKREDGVDLQDEAQLEVGRFPGAIETAKVDELMAISERSEPTRSVAKSADKREALQARSKQSTAGDQAPAKTAAEPMVTKESTP